jgi:hypothetical protein
MRGGCSFSRVRARAGLRLGALTGLIGFTVLVGVLPGCGGSEDAAFEALQVRGEEAMGVDQYIAVHQFDALEDGGRIELQHGDDDPDAIATIRAHLQEIEAAFTAGDFSIPAFVHDMPVPGTDVMSARRELIRYEFRELPRGGEVRIFSDDAEVLDAIRAFMAFQRMDHRAAGMDHSAHGGH